MRQPRVMMGGRFVAMAVAALMLTACGGNDDFESDATGPEPTVASPQTSDRPSASTSANRPPRVTQTIASGLAVPWGIAFLPDKTALVTERDSGRVLRIQQGHRPVQVGRVTQTEAAGEAGLLGIAVSPDFADNSRVFVYVTTATDNRVLRYRLVENRLVRPTAILTGIPKGFTHDGGGLAFDEDGNLFVSTGETGDEGLAQDPDSLAGKILRITENGEPADGNPQDDSAVYSIGHRNVQGLAFDDDENLWASEFGWNQFDELNKIEPGNNYGWPNVEGRSDQDRFRNPAVVWRTDEASPSGLAYTDGHLWMAALKGARLWRIDVSDGQSGNPVDFFVGDYGRLRAVVTAPDGTLWVTTSNHDGRGTPAPADDRILQVDPEPELG